MSRAAAPAGEPRPSRPVSGRLPALPERGAASAPSRRPAASEPLPLAVARGAPLLLLAAFGAVHWVALAEPAPSSAAWTGVLAALCATTALRAAAGRSLRAARVIGALAAAGAAAVALVAAGVPGELLAPGSWDALAAGIGRGLDGITGVNVPYRGLEEWTRIAITLGVTATPAAAALLAFWPRRGDVTGFAGAALVLLVALYVVPAVALEFPGEFLRGAVLAVLVLAFLRLDRVRLPDAPGAAAATATAALVALLAAPALDRDEPWWDYETWALSAAASKSTTFSWEHEYGPLDWPRDGREVLRIRASRPAYWKAENLDFFDGERWRRGRPFGMREAGAWEQLPDDLFNQERWAQEIRVSVRDLRTRTFVTAGTAMQVDMPRRMTLPMGAGIFATTGVLRRGDAYSARVYTPRPSRGALARAGTAYAPWLQWYRAVVLPARGGIADPRPVEQRGVLAIVPPLGDDREPVARVPFSRDAVPAREQLEDTALSRAWGLAQDLRERSETPYGFARRIEAHLRRGFAYTETPDPRAGTLEGFLFDAREGYCQQFSGAMALLLRLGGVPARVAAGFTSGSFDADAGEFVVRDLDAHSWVEAWFPGYGWVPFDPTPAGAATSSPASGLDVPAAPIGDAAGAGADTSPDPRAADAPEPESGRPLGALALLVAGIAATAGVLVRRRAVPVGVAELERALRRAGVGTAPSTTLRALERHFAAHPPAAAYVRALREARYGGRGGSPRPTPAQRRALRGALRGDGRFGRLRGWWALPPWRA